MTLAPAEAAKNIKNAVEGESEMIREEASWQPDLVGGRLRLRALRPNDFAELFGVASDRLIWEQHPDSGRYQEEVFKRYFESGLASGGALVIIDRSTDQIIGSSRYTNYSKENSSVEIGFTFLARKYWGGFFNRELKTLMLNYAFQFVNTVYFFVGSENHRSRRAMQKIGGVLVHQQENFPVDGDLTKNVIYKIERT